MAGQRASHRQIDVFRPLPEGLVLSAQLLVHLHAHGNTMSTWHIWPPPHPSITCYNRPGADPRRHAARHLHVAPGLPHHPHGRPLHLLAPQCAHHQRVGTLRVGLCIRRCCRACRESAAGSYAVPCTCRAVSGRHLRRLCGLCWGGIYCRGCVCGMSMRPAPPPQRLRGRSVLDCALPLLQVGSKTAVISTSHRCASCTQRN